MTTLYLRDVAPTDPLAGVSLKRQLASSRGASATTYATDTTVGGMFVQVTADTTDDEPLTFISEPLEAVTIDGAITVALRFWESSNSANVRARVIIDRLDSHGKFVSQIADQTAGAEASTTAQSVETISIAAGSVTTTALDDGDRLRITVYGSGATMNAGHTFSLSVNGASGGNGDSSAAFTETLVETTVPSGSGAAGWLVGAVLIGGGAPYEWVLPTTGKSSGGQPADSMFTISGTIIPASADRLLLLWLATYQQSPNTQDVPGVSGSGGVGGTWHHVTGFVWNTYARIDLYASLSASNFSGFLTFTTPDTTQAWLHSVVEFSGVDTSAGALAAIAEVATATEAGASDTIAVALADAFGPVAATFVADEATSGSGYDWTLASGFDIATFGGNVAYSYDASTPAENMTLITGVSDTETDLASAAFEIPTAIKAAIAVELVPSP